MQKSILTLQESGGNVDFLGISYHRVLVIWMQYLLLTDNSETAL